MSSKDRNWGGATWQGPLSWPRFDTSRVYDLAVRYENGMTHHGAHRPYTYELVKKHGDHSYPGGISAAMEFITLGAHVGTHVDAPGHISLDGCVSDGRDIMSAQDAETGVSVGSVEELPPLYGPAHLVDGEKMFGREMTHKDGFGAEELEEWFATRTAPKENSIVLFRTGWMKYWDDSKRYLGTDVGLPGVNLSGARWLSERGVRAVGADTVNFEHKPEWTVPAMSVHVHMLVEKGIPIMESLNLEQVAADEVYNFFFAASPLRIGGGTGAPIRPLAFVEG